MAISAMQIYLIGQADSLITTCSVIFFIGFVVSLFIFMLGMGSIENIEDSSCIAVLVRSSKKLLYWLTIPLAIVVFTPSSKTLAAMYIIPKIADSQFMKQVPDKLTSLANEWLDKQIKDIKAEETK
jgi:cytosine/uracil/thiamine/allantoin permease